MSFYYSLLGPVRYHYVQTKMFSVRYRQKSAQFIVSILIYLPPATKLGACWEIFSVACVDNSVHRGWSASVHAGIPPLSRDQAPPSDQAPPWNRHPGTRHPPGEQTPPCAVHAGRYGQQAGGMHPTGMQSCLNLMSTAAHSPQIRYHCLGILVI